MDKERTLYGNLITTPRNLSGTMPGEMIFGVQGPQGPVGPTGLTGKEGPRGPAGSDGVSPTVAIQPVANGNIITITDVNGIVSFTVKDGTGVQIFGTYETVDALLEEHPTGSVGESYMVNGELYVWSANDNGWKNAGSIQGPPGKDGIVGKDGKDGEDGISATHSWNGTVLTVTSASGTSSADLKGSDGNDGVSATHSWNGTTLTVTSASGTSSANLKGADGATPQRGTDYWTAADIAEIKSYVDEAILGGAW